MMNVIVLNVIMLSVVAPQLSPSSSYLAASLSAALSLKVVCLMSSKFLYNGSHDLEKNRFELRVKERDGERERELEREWERDREQELERK